jgi:PD-(D/E)XK endonuclease
MKHWERFKNFKQRGEWVELQFMAQAALRRFNVCRPWGDMRPYDVGIEHMLNFLRVQVKSTTQQVGGGYRCQLRPKHRKMEPYTLKRLDLFAAYVIPVDVWYLIPAAMILEAPCISDVMLSPVVPPTKKKSYRYECYREAWNLLTKSRSELLLCGN